MGAADLKASLTLHSTQFETAIARAEAKAAAFANKVQNNFSKKIGNLFGAGAIAGLLYNPVAKVFGGVTGFGDRAKNIDEGAKRLGITTNEFQAIEEAAKNSGMGVDQFIAAVKRGEIPLQNAIKTIREFKATLSPNDIANAKQSDRTLAKAGDQVTKGFAYLVDVAVNYFRFLGASSVTSDKGDIMKVLRQMRGEDAESVGAQAGNQKSLEDLFSSDKKGRGLPGVNELQKIGAFVGGSDPTRRAIESTAANTQRANGQLDKIIQALTNGQKQAGQQLSVLDFF